MYTADGLGTYSGNTITNRDGSTYTIPSHIETGVKRSGSGSSAYSVGSSAGTYSDSLSSMADQLTSVMDQVYKITERNTARSEQQAAELRDWQERQNQLAMNFNSAEAAKNRNWQEMMSNTAHQREIRDLQAAGLNPVLSAMGGNGAAVTSGATASGVTSAGAKGEVDTSADAALVNLMGAMWSAQTQLESQRINAQTNLAIAEKNNSTSQLVAEMYTQQSREAAQLAAETNLKTSQISAAVSELVSRISANASYYASNANITSATLYTEASKVVAGMNVDGAYRNTLVNGIVDLAQAGISADVALRGQDVSASSARDVAEIGNKRSSLGFIDSSLKDATGSSIGDWLGTLFGTKKKSSGFAPRSSSSTFGGRSR